MNEPAYPNTIEDVQYSGLTIRDYFASAATDKDVSHYMWHSDDPTYPDCSRETAKYLYADAMLEARKPKADLAGLGQYKRETSLHA